MQTLQKKAYIAIELILEDGLSVDAAANRVGETPDIVRNWLEDYEKSQDEKIIQQEAEFIAKQKHNDDLQKEIHLQRQKYDHIIANPDPSSEKLALKQWDNFSEIQRHKVITNADCIDCGATIITDYVMQYNNQNLHIYGNCGKCGKSMLIKIMG